MPTGPTHNTRRSLPLIAPIVRNTAVLTFVLDSVTAPLDETMEDGTLGWDGQRKGTADIIAVSPESSVAETDRPGRFPARAKWGLNTGSQAKRRGHGGLSPFRHVANARTGDWLQ